MKGIEEDKNGNEYEVRLNKEREKNLSMLL